VADQQALQAADLVVEGRKRHQLRLDRIPGRKRIDEQAAARIGGDDQTAAAIAGETFAMPRWNGETSLGIEGQLGDAAKDRPARRRRHVARPTPGPCLARVLVCVLRHVRPPLRPACK
jgi:hypothetical protein